MHAKRRCKWIGGKMKARTFMSDRARIGPAIGIVLTLALLIFSLGACGRQNSTAARYASTTDNPTANSGISNPSTNAAPAVMPVLSYADVVSKVAPAVVTIHSQLRVRQPQQFPFTDDPFFQQFFGDRGLPAPQVPQHREALGSGVLVTAD